MRPHMFDYHLYHMMKYTLNSQNLIQNHPEKIFDKYSLLENDELRIKEMLNRHVNYTNSFKAKLILDKFDENIKKFVKVLPIDFKNALQKSKHSETSSEDEKLWPK